MNSSNRIEWLDYMKGVAILIVVLGHMAQHIGAGYVFAESIIVCEFMLLLSYPIEHNKYLRKYIFGKF